MTGARRASGSWSSVRSPPRSPTSSATSCRSFQRARTSPGRRSIAGTPPRPGLTSPRSRSMLASPTPSSTTSWRSRAVSRSSPSRSCSSTLEELARVGAEALDEPPLPFGVERVERERRLARAARTRERNERSGVEDEVDALEVVGASPAEPDRPHRASARPWQLDAKRRSGCHRLDGLDERDRAAVRHGDAPRKRDPEPRPARAGRDERLEDASRDAFGNAGTVIGHFDDDPPRLDAGPRDDCRNARRVKGRRCYLYRAIDSRGATIDLLLSALRDADAAKRLFRKALGDRSHPQPRVVLLLKLGLVAMGLPQS